MRQDELELIGTASNIFEQISGKGGFLITGSDKPNIMTFGWAYVGYMWRRASLLVVVRHSRYSHDLLEKSANFTITIPETDQMSDELLYCSTSSGRSSDKFAETGLKLLPPRAGRFGGIDGCKLTVECKTLMRTDFPLEDFLDKSLCDMFYSDGNIHTGYFGQILAAYNQ
jgi:flavin reductase (DIM6/NTAB) family NADH-FMN oxidoreductase RutF